jgi:hypothetical protein
MALMTKEQIKARMMRPCEECFMYYECPSLASRESGESCPDFESDMDRKEV